jgi:hypothetical protein
MSPNRFSTGYGQGKGHPSPAPHPENQTTAVYTEELTHLSSPVNTAAGVVNRRMPPDRNSFIEELAVPVGKYVTTLPASNLMVFKSIEDNCSPSLSDSAI